MSNDNSSGSSTSKGSAMEKKYKFKELKIYDSDEWMAGSTKKYRRVFDRAETAYIWAEVAFFNKLFDEEDWETNYEIKCFQVTGDPEHGERKEICCLKDSLKVSRDENIIAIHRGWGNDTPGAFWEKGDYLWEAYLDGQLIGKQTMYINDVGLVNTTSNPYFGINHIKLYSGDAEGWKDQTKKYLKKFNRSSTPYIWVELNFKVFVNTNFWYEVFFNFYDDAGQPKGTCTRMYKMDDGKLDWNYTIDGAWGTDSPGSWKDNNYTVEIVFMDTLLAVVPFETGDTEEEGVIEILSGNNALLNKSPVTENTPEQNIEELLLKLDALTGLESVKKGIRDNINYLNFLKIRKEKGFDDNGKMNLHSVFTGNPGTGKTTVVNMLGKIYFKMGLLSKGHVKEVDRSDLVAEYIGQTAPKVKKAIDEARGGILFIDEAYSLARTGLDSKDFGQEVLEILIKEMSDGKGDIAIMCAGYPKEMQDFVEANPGLRSRFSHYFNFEDYLPEELIQIALIACEKRSVKLSAEARTILEDKFTLAYRARDRTFGNARYANGVIEEAKMNLGLRLMKHPNLNDLSMEEMSVIEAEDVLNVFAAQSGKKLHLEVDEKMLRDTLAELNALTGMNTIKTDVNELVKLVRFYKETGKDVLNKFSLHSVFTGNPGTGKTTVARIIAKIYKGLGLLERGHVVEVDREGLVAGYIGQTAVKTAEKIQQAMGGVLFIDEAYALADRDGGNDFGHEAVEVVLKRMEDERGKFAVIVAGYPDNMNTFIESNPGLKSRFDRTYIFQDYCPEEMFTIALRLFSLEDIRPDEEASAHLKNYFEQLYAKRDKTFGNARTVRQVVGDAVKHQNLRLASMDSSQRTRELLATILLDDVKHLSVTGEENAGRIIIGFKKP